MVHFHHKHANINNKMGTDNQFYIPCYDFFSFIITWATTMMQVSLSSLKLKTQKDPMSYLVLYHSIQTSGIVLLENKDGLPTGHMLPILSWDDAVSTS